MAKNRGGAICADSRSDTSYVLTFEYDDGADGHDELRILRFNTDESWADFIVRNRKGLPLEVDFDIAIGPSADGDIGHILDLYERSSGDAKKELIDSLSDNDLGIQYCFHSQKSIDKYLKFIRSDSFDEVGNPLHAGRSASLCYKRIR